MSHDSHVKCSQQFIYLLDKQIVAWIFVLYKLWGILKDRKPLFFARLWVALQTGGNVGGNNSGECSKYWFFTFGLCLCLFYM